jgi:hypothetical protein
LDRKAHYFSPILHYDPRYMMSPAIFAAWEHGRTIPLTDMSFSDFRNGLEGCNFFRSCDLDVPKSLSLRSVGAIGRRPNFIGHIMS